MARTDATAVQAILGDDYDLKAAPSLAPFIETATAIVTRVAACATAKDETLTAAELELIERWLAAHFYACSDKPYSSRSTKGASGSFHGQTAMYFEATLYGQQAILLDPSGCLNTVGKRQSAGGFWLGKRRSEQTDYQDRD